MRFVLRRAGFFLLTLWVAVTLNFFLPRMMPGNPAIAMMGKFRGKVGAQELQTLETIFGAGSHQSLPSQYAHYLGDVFTGNFGTSLFYFPSPVSQVVRGAIFWTLGLVGVTTILAFIPIRVRNIFICGTVAFCPSSRMITASFRVRPRM